MGHNMNNSDKPKQAATIYDIAKAAGVAPGTVSRTLNNIGYIKDETRQRVEAAVAGLKYTPNRAARTLKTKKTGLLLLAIPDMDNPFYADMIKSVQHVAKSHDYSLILYYTEGKASEEIKALKMLHEHYADGMILINFSYSTRHQKEIERINAPLVLSSISKSHFGGKENDRFDYVGVDAGKGVYLAVKHLAQQGHTCIAYIAGPKGVDLFQERYEGYLQALQECGLNSDDALVSWSKYTESHGSSAVETFMSLREKPTAICCANDILALGALRAVQDLGLNVPQDISIVGMDNIDTTLKVRPMLSTVAIAQAEIGKTAADIIFSRLDGTEKRPSIKRIFEPRLIVRDSSISNR